MSKDAMVTFCRSLPGAEEDVKWEVHLVYSVGGKMFAIFDVSGSERVRLKVGPDDYAVLTQQPGISPAPHLARYHWIELEHGRVLPSEAVEDLLRESYDLISAKLPRRVRERLGAAAR